MVGCCANTCRPKQEPGPISQALECLREEEQSSTSLGGGQLPLQWAVRRLQRGATAVALLREPAMLRGGHPERRGDRDERYAVAGGAGCSQPGGQRAHYPLQLFRRGHLLLARNVIRSERFWPVLGLYSGSQVFVESCEACLLARARRAINRVCGALARNTPSA